MVKLRDVHLTRKKTSQCHSAEKGNTEFGEDRIEKDGTNSINATFGAESEGRGVEMEEVVATAGRGRGRYAVGARWHDGTMAMMAGQRGNAALQWRYGDG